METITSRSGIARTDDCGCGGRSVSTGGTRNGGGFAFGTLERPRYYPRQLMTPDDLNLEAAYFRDRLRRHNLFLHGWGVVCGALVCAVPARSNGVAQKEYRRRRSDLKNEAAGKELSDATEPLLVRIQPGYIIGPYGDEIVIDQSIEVSLRGDGMNACGSDSADDDVDRWCAEVFVARKSGPIYIAVKYRECPAMPVPVAPGGCDCADEGCEYARYRDGFAIGLLDCCPDSHRSEAYAERDRPLRKGGNPRCPECPDDPWVVLAKVEIDADGVVQVIDNCDCRRIMRTTRDLWTVCTGSDCDSPEKPDDDPTDTTSSEESEATASERGTGVIATVEDKP